MAWIALCATLFAAPVCAETAASLERDADARMERGQYQLAQNLYKLALQRDAKNEFLWVKYDLAHERYLRVIGSASRAKLPAPAKPEPRAETTRDPEKQPADPDNPDASPDASPAPEESTEPTPEPRAERDPSETPSVAAASDTLYRSPSELIYLPRPVRAGDTSPVSGAEDGQPITVKTPHYEISQIEFVVDPNGSLHVRGKVKNLSTDRDFRNPQVYVALFDKLGVQIALKPVRMANVGGVLFRGDTGEFDAPFPKFNTTVGAYRVSLDP